MGGSASDKLTTIVRQSNDLESANIDLINYWKDQWDDHVDNHPYRYYVPVDLGLAFFGIGYSLASYPALYDIFGRYMAGVDLDTLYNRVFTLSTTGDIINTAVAEQAQELSDDIEQNVLPRFEAGMRDINAVSSSSFVVGRSLIEATRVKALSKYSADLKYRMLPIAADVFKTYLIWNKDITNTYGQLLKLYLSAESDHWDQWMEFAVKGELWNYTILEQLRLIIGAAQGGTRTTSDVVGAPTKTQKVIGGAMSGAAVGTEINAGWGTAIGAVVGAAAGYFS